LRPELLKILTVADLSVAPPLGVLMIYTVQLIAGIANAVYSRKQRHLVTIVWRGATMGAGCAGEALPNK